MSNRTKKWSSFKCPTPGGLAFAPKDRPTLHLVAYNDGKFKGEACVTMGEHAAELAAFITEKLQEREDARRPKPKKKGAKRGT